MDVSAVDRVRGGVELFDKALGEGVHDVHLGAEALTEVTSDQPLVAHGHRLSFAPTAR